MSEDQELYPPYAAWREAALLDGWEEAPGGPWGKLNKGQRYEGDRSVLLSKDDMIVWLVDRWIERIGRFNGYEGHNERWTAGWYARGYMAMQAVPEVYDPEALELGRGICHVCNEMDDPSRLRPIGFAGRVCPECDTKELRDKIEFPGWAD